MIPYSKNLPKMSSIIEKNVKLRISAIIPHFNHENFLQKSLEKLSAQKLPADEIIIVDDCSNEESFERVRQLAAKYHNVKVARNKKNSGVIFTLNRGLALATGDFVYCGAADDYVTENLFHDLVKSCPSDLSAGFLTGEVRIENLNGERLGVRPMVLISNKTQFVEPRLVRRKLASADNLFLSVATLYHREKLIGLGGFDEKLGPFADGFVLRQLALKHGYVFVRGAIGVWVERKSSYSQALLRETIEEKRRIEACFSKARSDEHMGEEYAEKLRKRLHFFSLRRKILGGDTLPDLFENSPLLPNVHILIRLLLILPRRITVLLILCGVIIVHRPINVTPVLYTLWLRWVSH